MTERRIPSPWTWTPRARVAMWGLSALLSLSFLTQIRTFDFWWHLATGRWIVENGQLPSVDPFSFTMLGAKWSDVAWLPDLLMFGVYRAFGFAGIVVSKAMVAFAFLLLLARLLRELTVSVVATGLTLVLVTVLVQDRFGQERPEAMTVPFVVLGMLIVVRFFERPGRDPLWFVPLAGAWMFIHVTALLCLPLAGLCAAWSSLPARWTGVPSAERRRVVATTWLAFGLVVLLFALVPRGREVFEHARGSNATWFARLTREWTPLDWHGPVPYAALTYHVVAFLAAGSACRAAVRNGGTRAVWAALGFALLGVSIGLQATRNVALGALFSAPGVALSLDALRSALVRANSPFGWVALVAAFPVTVPGTLVAFLHWPFDAGFGLGVDQGRFYADSVDVLRRLPVGRTFNALGHGGHLIWERIPGGVFVDGRSLQVYDEAFVRDVLYPMLTDPEALERTSDRYDVRYGLIAGDSFDAKALMGSAHWLPVFYGAASTLFVRERYLAETAPTLQRLGFKPYRHLRFISDQAWMDEYYRPLLADPVRKAELGQELVRAYSSYAGRTVRGAAKYLKTEDREFTRAVVAALQGAQRADGATE